MIPVKSFNFQINISNNNNNCYDDNTKYDVCLCFESYYQHCSCKPFDVLKIATQTVTERTIKRIHLSTLNVRCDMTFVRMLPTEH